MALAVALSVLVLLLAPYTQAFHTVADDTDCIGRNVGSMLWGCGTGGAGGPSGPAPHFYNQFGLLADWGFVGYHQGGKIYRPDPKIFNDRFNVKNFGAKGDMKTDDTAAFEKAIAAWNNLPEQSSNGVIFVPRGNYIITRPLTFTKAGTVVRGAGKQGTFSETNLIFKGSLAAAGKNVQTDAWLSWEGKGDILTGNLLATITATALRGSTKLFVDSNTNVPAGSLVLVVMTENAAGDLQKLFLGGEMGKAGIVPVTYIGKNLFTFKATVISKGVDGGKPFIRLNRVLPLEISTLALQPSIYKYAPSMSEVGIEMISIKFPWSEYKGVGKETGNNAIAFKGVSEFYLHQVNITNADFGVLATNSRGGTLTGIVYNSDLPRSTNPLVAADSTSFAKFSDRTTDSLALHFKIANRVPRTIVVEGFSGMNAITANDNGLDVSIKLGGCPWSNLFSALALGMNGQLFNWDGTTGAYNTFYNVKTPAKQALNTNLADYQHGYSQLVMGAYLDTNALRVAGLNKWWQEGVAPYKGLTPGNMYTAQVYSRNKRTAALV